MTLALMIALSGSAHAESEILFRTTRPVLIYVDGRQAPITGNLKMRAENLNPGTHEVEVRGVFGKTLYTTEIDLEDQTVAHAEWAMGELAVYRTEALRKGRSSRTSPWSDDEEPMEDSGEADGEANGEADDEAEPALVLPAEEVSADPIAQAPVEDPDDGVADAALALPVEPVPGVEPEPVTVAEPAPAPATPVELPDELPAGGAVKATTIQAREGAVFRLVSGEEVLYISVNDGAFVLDFSQD